MTALAVDGVAKAFGGLIAVDHVSFSLAAGECVGLIGPNGAGKSTLFALIGGQTRVDRGHVRIDGARVDALSPRGRWRRGLARSFQISRVFSSMPPLEAVQTALAQRNRPFLFAPIARHAKEEAMALLDAVGLADTAAPAAHLAYGAVKRLELAIALSSRPKVLLMDEPTAALAPDGRAALLALAREQAATRGAAVLITEHDVDSVFAVADRVLAMADGRLIADGPPDEVRRNADVRRVYIGG